jgi:hypothetical protein
MSDKTTRDCLDVVERLRAAGDARGVDTGRENVERVAERMTEPGWSLSSSGPTVTEAAALLRALVAERDELCAAMDANAEVAADLLDRVAAERDAARAEAERLRTALKKITRNWPDSFAALTARAALSAPAAKGGGDE